MPNQIEDPGRSGWWSTELGATIGVVVHHAVVLGMTLAIIDSSQGVAIEKMVGIVTAMLGEMAAVTAKAWKFTSGREHIKVEAFRAMAAQRVPITITPSAPEVKPSDYMRGPYG
jgi:hypothetical protein